MTVQNIPYDDLIHAQIVTATSAITRPSSSFVHNNGQETIKKNNQLLAVNFKQVTEQMTEVWQAIIFAQDGYWQLFDSTDISKTNQVALNTLKKTQAQVEIGDDDNQKTYNLVATPKRFHTNGINSKITEKIQEIIKKTEITTEDQKTIFNILYRINIQYKPPIREKNHWTVGSLSYLTRKMSEESQTPTAVQPKFTSPPKPSRPPPVPSPKTSTKTPTAEDAKPASPSLFLKNHNRLEDILLGTWFFLFSSLSIYCFYMARNSD